MEEKIDIVYLWCDGNEENFIKRKNQYLHENIEPNNEQVIGDVRYYDNDELKYSLRSLEKYASWINHIYIVTDNQVPTWLNIQHSKITIVDIADIMPSELVPCFNSNLIERYISFIPGLTEHFLYACDDTFFGRKVGVEFFLKDGKTIVRVRNLEGIGGVTAVTSAKMFENLYASGDIYVKYCLNAWRLLYSKYEKIELYHLHHNIDIYTKIHFIETLERFKEEFKGQRQRFRSSKDIQRVIFNLDEVYSGKAHLELQQPLTKWKRRLKRYLGVNIKFDSFYCSEDDYEQFKKIKKYQPSLFCINAAVNATKEDKVRTKKFLEELFPEKSSFEI